MITPLSPLISNTCTVAGCTTEARYKASCNHILCRRHVIQIDSGASLLCPVNQELIENSFRLVSNPNRVCNIDLIRSEKSHKAEILCCAICVLWGVGFIYFHFR